MAAANVSVESDKELDEGLLAQFRKKAGSLLKSALQKVLGVFDAKGRFVLIDRTVHAVKQTFVKLHELGHACLPWQKDIYAVIEDCNGTLDPDVADRFDKEA